MILITCEHAVNHIPPGYTFLFATAGRLLHTHRAFDRGALELARTLARRLDGTLISGNVTRLLVDLNRSLHNREVLSSISRRLDHPMRDKLLTDYYHTYRSQVISLVEAGLQTTPPVWHISVHTFTPVRQGVVRRADIGLLYDPKRSGEVKLCRQLQASLRQVRPDLIVRRNYPYRGIADGMTSSLRKCFAHSQYVGVELEVNQRWPRKGGRTWSVFQQDLSRPFAIRLQQEHATS